MNSPRSCIYCGASATTKDHIPPLGLFPKNRRNGNLPIKVPSCKDCNNGASLDDEFFRLFVAGHSADRSEPAKEIFETSIRRAASYKPGVIKSFLNRMEVIDTHSPMGIYTGKATAVTFTSSDWKRLFRVVDRIVKGLIYYEFSETLPADFEVRTMFADDEKVKQALPAITTNTSKSFSDIFNYAYGKVPESVASVWLTGYYERITFLTFVAPAGTFKESSDSKRQPWIVDMR